MPEIASEFLFQVRFDVPAIHDLGAGPFGNRRIAEVTGGTFEGPRLKGTVMPAPGGDWLLLRADGVLQLDVRVTLKTDDGALIYMTYRGLRHGPKEVIERLNRGEAVDPASYYFRTSPVFETAAPKYDWLNRIIAVGTGRRQASGPIYDVFEIL